jgi:hypothetical protein
MADSKISALTAITGANVADNDLFPTVDVSDTTMAATGTTKIITAAELGKAVGANGRLNLGPYTSTTPSAPTTGVTLFSRFKAGRNLPAFIGPSGLESSLQPHFAANCVSFVRPSGNGTVIASQGIVVTATGTATAANWANTSFLASLKRISYVSAATAGSSGGMREAVLKYWRGNAAGLGGFDIRFRFGFATISTTRRWFVGLVGVTTALASAEPSTNANILGVGQDTADTTVQFMHKNSTAGTAVKSVGSTSLSSPAVNEVWDVRIFAAPNASSVTMSVEKLNGGSYSEYTTGVSTDIPANTQGLALQLWANNGTTAAIIDPHLVSLYAETDY